MTPSQANTGLSSLSHKSFSERVKAAFFETVCFIGLPPNTNEGTKVAVGRLVLVEVRWLLQLLPYLEAEETQDNGVLVHGFWFAVSCIRPDMIMSYLSLAWAWLILVWVGVCACWSLFAIVFTLTFLNRKTHPRLRKLLQVFGQLLLSLISIPSANILLSSWFPDSRFGNGIATVLFASAGYVSLIVYMGLISFQCTMIIANFEPDFTLGLLRGKSQMDADFLTLVVAQTVMVSYYVLFDSHKTLHNVLVLLVSLPLMLRYHTQLPHYRPLANGVAAWSRTALTCSALAMLVGQRVSPLCSLLLLVALNVSVGFILLLGFESYQQRRIAGYAKRLSEHMRVYEYELGIRYYIFRAMGASEDCKSTKGALAVSRVDQALRFCPDSDRKTLILIKYLIYLNLLRNERAARVSLSQAVMLKSTVTSSFLEFKAKWMLTASTQLEEIVFLRYLEKLDGVREKDEKLCHRLSDLWSELGCKRPSKARVLLLASQVYREVKFLKREFTTLVKNFPSGYDLYDLYGSFVRDVLGKTRKAKVLEMQGEYLMDEIKKQELKDEVEAVKFFDPLAGIVLVDTHSKGLGAFLYMNSTAAELLGCDLKSLGLYKISNIIPQPYSGPHLKNIKQFVETTQSMQMEHPSILPLATTSGFIVFCAVKLFLTSNNGLPLLALAFKPLKSLTSGAILSREGVIQTHTKDFSRYLLNEPNKHIEQTDLAALRYSLFRHRNPLGESEPFQLFSNRTYWGKFARVKFSSSAVDFFYVFENGNVQVDKVRATWDIVSLDVKLSQLATNSSNGFLISSEEPMAKPEKRANFAQNEPEADTTPAQATSPGEESQAFSEVHSNNHQLLRKLHSAHRFSVYVSGFMVLALLTINVTGCVMAQWETQKVTTGTSLADVSRRELALLQVALNARLITKFDGSNAKYRANFDYFLGLLEETQANVWTEIAETHSLEYQRLMTRADTPTWQLLDNSTRFSYKPLIDALQFVLDSVSSS